MSKAPSLAEQKSRHERPSTSEQHVCNRNASNATTYVATKQFLFEIRALPSPVSLVAFRLQVFTPAIENKHGEKTLSDSDETQKEAEQVDNAFAAEPAREETAVFEPLSADPSNQ